jgi:hypothetical protein
MDRELLDNLFESYLNVYDERESCELDEVTGGEDVDLYDLVLEYLLDEGLCETVENAEIMMAHMSEQWIDRIVEGYQLDEAQVDKEVTRGIENPVDKILIKKVMRDIRAQSTLPHYTKTQFKIKNRRMQLRAIEGDDKPYNYA